MPRLLELFCGTKSIAEPSRRQAGRSLDIVSKFEPTILCDIRSWDYTLFPPGHFDMVRASPVCTEYRRCVLDDLRRATHWCSEPLRSWRASTRSCGSSTGLLKTSVREADVDPTCAGGRAEGCAGAAAGEAWEDGRHLRGAQGGPRLMGGQRSYGAAQGDCDCGHGRACGSAEHPGLNRGSFFL